MNVSLTQLRSFPIFYKLKSNPNLTQRISSFSFSLVPSPTPPLSLTRQLIYLPYPPSCSGDHQNMFTYSPPQLKPTYDCLLEFSLSFTRHPLVLHIFILSHYPILISILPYLGTPFDMSLPLIFILRSHF